MAKPAFRWLSVATVLMIVPISVIDRSVLHYFTYSLGDAARGRLTLGAMMAVSGAAAPRWLALSRAIGLRLVWLMPIGLCLADVAAFVAFDPAATMPVQTFLIVMQGGAVWLSYAMWAPSPQAIEIGRRAGEEGAGWPPMAGWRCCSAWRSVLAR